ncbi:putative polyamine transporter [Hibiscus syriacus]|uniref:Polyamine transporter n=1 Tax=Hibiscus syriacus TaxID=106335 RepID=A0A6A3ACG3_HIBSY|nr:putative polyamine transporter [Hibiscus syriacus]
MEKKENSIPEALITAELSTTFPQNGGYVTWISSAFGPFWGFQQGFWKWFSGVMDNALYPVLFLDYLKHSFPIFNHLAARQFPLMLSLLPFLVMGIISIPRLKPRQWLVVDFEKVDWRGYFNSMFWNMNYWHKASTLAGEVENPSKTFPKALRGAVILVVLSYLIPLLAGTGSLRSSHSEWIDGYFAEVGMLIGGFWLKWWVQAAAAMSNLGLFEAEMSGDAFQLLGMSEMGMLPVIFGSSFQEILEFLNFLYSIGMLLEFAAFIKLRIKNPDLHRPYGVPLQTFGATMLCLPPALLLVLVMCLASAKTFIMSGIVIIVGILMYPVLVHAKNRKWTHFADTEHRVLPLDNPDVAIPSLEVSDEASACLLPVLNQEVSQTLPDEALKLE